MSAAQVVFWGVGASLALGLPVFFYPGVRRFAESARDSVIASVAAGLLCAAGAALVAGYAVNAMEQLLR